LPDISCVWGVYFDVVSSVPLVFVSPARSLDHAPQPVQKVDFQPLNMVVGRESGPWRVIVVSELDSRRLHRSRGCKGCCVSLEQLVLAAKPEPLIGVDAAV
jgi:hypothetical protein